MVFLSSLATSKQLLWLFCLFSSCLFHVIGGLEYSWILSLLALISSNPSFLFCFFLLCVCPGRIAASICFRITDSFTHVSYDRNYYVCCVGFSLSEPGWWDGCLSISLFWQKVFRMVPWVSPWFFTRFSVRYIWFYLQLLLLKFSDYPCFVSFD